MGHAANTLAAMALCAGATAACASESSLGFAVNVSRHVLLHEVGHALIREFDLPKLANEEDMADTFATLFILQAMRDDARAILKDRARSWLYEGAQVSPEDYDLEGEHELDTRRAFRTICLLYGADPAAFSDVLDWIGLSEDDADDCSDFTPDMIEAGRASSRRTGCPTASSPTKSSCSMATPATPRRSGSRLCSRTWRSSCGGSRGRTGSCCTTTPAAARARRGADRSAGYCSATSTSAGSCGNSPWRRAGDRRGQCPDRAHGVRTVRTFGK